MIGVQEHVEVLRKRDVGMRIAQFGRRSLKCLQRFGTGELWMLPFVEKVVPSKKRALLSRCKIPVQQPKRFRVFQKRIESLAVENGFREGRQLEASSLNGVREV